MTDTDHGFEPDLLYRLLTAMIRYKVDVASGLYLKKEHPHRPTLWRWRGDKYAELRVVPEGEAQEMDAAGAGCLLIKRSVFEKIEREMKEEPFSVSEFPGVTGEDFAFFKRCQMLGIPRAFFPWIESHHLQVKRLTLKDDHDPDFLYPHETDETIRTTKYVAGAA